MQLKRLIVMQNVDKITIVTPTCVADEISLESRTSLATRHFRPPGLPCFQSNMQNGFH